MITNPQNHKTSLENLCSWLKVQCQGTGCEPCPQAVQVSPSSNPRWWHIYTQSSGFFQYFYIQIHLIHQKVLPTYFYMKMRKQKPNEHTTKKQNTLIFCFIVSESISIPIIKCIWFKTIFPSSQFLSILLVRESFLKCWFTGFSWNSDSKITKRYFYTWAIFLNITCTEKNKMQVIFWIQVITESWYQLP